MSGDVQFSSPVAASFGKVHHKPVDHGKRSQRSGPEFDDPPFGWQSSEYECAPVQSCSTASPNLHTPSQASVEAVASLGQSGPALHQRLASFPVSDKHMMTASSVGTTHSSGHDGAARSKAAPHPGSSSPPLSAATSSPAAELNARTLRTRSRDNESFKTAASHDDESNELDDGRSLSPVMESESLPLDDGPTLALMARTSATGSGSPVARLLAPPEHTPDDPVATASSSDRTLRGPNTFTLDSLLAGNTDTAGAASSQPGQSSRDDNVSVTARLNMLLDADSPRPSAQQQQQRPVSHSVMTFTPSGPPTSATRSAPAKRHGQGKGAIRLLQGAGTISEDWDMMGTEGSETDMGHFGPSGDLDTAKLHRVPHFASGEPQFVFGDSGGFPSLHSSLARVIGLVPPQAPHSNAKALSTNGSDSSNQQASERNQRNYQQQQQQQHPHQGAAQVPMPAPRGASTPGYHHGPSSVRDGDGMRAERSAGGERPPQRRVTDSAAWAPPGQQQQQQQPRSSSRGPEQRSFVTARRHTHVPSDRSPGPPDYGNRRHTGTNPAAAQARRQALHKPHSMTADEYVPTASMGSPSSMQRTSPTVNSGDSQHTNYATAASRPYTPYSQHGPPRGRSADPRQSYQGPGPSAGPRQGPTLAEYGFSHWSSDGEMHQQAQRRHSMAVDGVLPERISPGYSLYTNASQQGTSSPMDHRSSASFMRGGMSSMTGKSKPSSLYASSTGEAARLYKERRFGVSELAHPGKKVQRWQEIAGQAQAVQKQIKKELCLMGSVSGDPLGRYHFHIPLFAAVWSMLRESCVVPNTFTRGYKEVVSAAVSRGNLCRFCCYWHANTASEMGVDGMREAWVKKTMMFLPTCPLRFKAIMLWFRDANHVAFFARQTRAPFTQDEAAELLAVSFINMFMNRCTIATLTQDETLPMMSIMRPIMQKFPGLHVAMYKTVMKPSSRETPVAGNSSVLRPHSQHQLGPDFSWAASLRPVAEALGHLEFVVNYHIGGRHLPLDLCSAFLTWMESNYDGIHRPLDPYGEWAYYAARTAYPTDAPRREALRYMLFIASDPLNVPKDSQASLKKLGWRSAQISAMPAYASFHASRFTVAWQAQVPCATPAEAANDSLWTVVVPDEELW